LALYQAYASQSGTVLVRSWIRPAVVPEGGGLYLRTALGSEDYIAFVARDGAVSYRYIFNGEERIITAAQPVLDGSACLRAVINVDGHTVTAMNGLGVNTGRFVSPNFHGVTDALATVELVAEGGTTVGVDGLQVIACQ